MKNETKKSPADISIEKANEILKKYGLPPTKLVSVKGVVIVFPTKDSPLLNYLKNNIKKNED